MIDNTVNPQTGELYEARVTPFLATPYNLNGDAWSLANGLGDFCPTKTKVSEQESTDINEIVRQFGLTGQLPDNPLPPTYGDFSDVLDYHTAMNAVKRADEAFMDLPAALRARFSNDPAALVEFLGEETNRAEALQLGLITSSQDASVSVGSPGASPGSTAPTPQAPA